MPDRALRGSRGRRPRGAHDGCSDGPGGCSDGPRGCSDGPGGQRFGMEHRHQPGFGSFGQPLPDGHHVHEHLELLGGGRSLLRSGQQLTTGRSDRPLERVDVVGRPRRRPTRKQGIPPVGCELRRCFRLLGRGGGGESRNRAESPHPPDRALGRLRLVGGADTRHRRLPLLGQLHRRVGLLGRGQRARREPESSGRHHHPLERNAVVSGPARRPRASRSTSSTR